MPPRSRDDLRRLHFINALFAHATGPGPLSRGANQGGDLVQPRGIRGEDRRSIPWARENVRRDVQRRRGHAARQSLRAAAAPRILSLGRVADPRRRDAALHARRSHGRPAHLAPFRERDAPDHQSSPGADSPERAAPPPAANATTRKPSPSSANSPPPAPSAARICSCCFCKREHASCRIQHRSQIRLGAIPGHAGFCTPSASAYFFHVKTIFQKIIDREIPARIEHEDEHCIVLHDIQPQAPVHLLIIPKKVIPRVGEAELMIKPCSATCSLSRARSRENFNSPMAFASS